MIVVKIELMSAITGRTTEIGRMYIANAGGTEDRGSYDVAVCKRGSTEVPKPVRPSGPAPTRSGKVKDYPRLAYNVWRLISRALLASFPEEKIKDCPEVESLKAQLDAARGDVHE